MAANPISITELRLETVKSSEEVLVRCSGRINSATSSNFQGTIRALILKRASSADLRPEERSLTRADLLRADAVFATNSIRLAAPCIALDGKPLGSNEPQPIKALQAMLLQAIEQECGA